ncbi:hypothetical protein V8C86DRAFT_3023653 [Haematococcus lacustris]
MRTLQPWAALACTLAFPIALAQDRYAPSATISTWVSGQASAFGGPQEGLDVVYNATLPSGSCGYGTQDVRLWPFIGIVGISRSSVLATARPMSGCGTCLEVRCTDTRPDACASANPISVTVLDTCASCNASQINLFALGFQQIGRTRLGTIAVQYRQVACQPPDGMEVLVDAWRPTDGGYLRLALRNVAGDGGLTAVELRGAAGNTSTAGNSSGSEWQPMVNGFAPATSWLPQLPLASSHWGLCGASRGAAWEVPRIQANPAGGFDLRVTNAVGESVIISHAWRVDPPFQQQRCHPALHHASKLHPVLLHICPVRGRHAAEPAHGGGRGPEIAACAWEEEGSRGDRGAGVVT